MPDAIEVGSEVVWTDEAKSHYYMRLRMKDGIGVVTNIRRDGERDIVRVRFPGRRKFQEDDICYIEELRLASDAVLKRNAQEDGR